MATGGEGEGEADGGLDAGGCEERTWYRDVDGDGWGADTDATTQCSQPEGFVARGGDCGPADAALHPTATEVCNGLDDDCANGPDDPFACVLDTSADCTTACGTTGTQSCGPTCIPSPCEPPPEICNYVDDDCDGLVDPEMQEALGAPVRLTDESAGVYDPRIDWHDGQLAVGWARDDYSFVVTTRDPLLAEIEALVLTFPKNVYRFIWDLAYSGTLFVALSDTGGEAGANRYTLFEYADDLVSLAEWHSLVGGSERVQLIESVSVESGSVTFFQTSNNDIRTRGVASGADTLHSGVTLTGTRPDAAVTPTGDVVVVYRTADGEMGGAIVDPDGDESIGHRPVTAIGGIVSYVAVAQARADTIVAVFSTSGGLAPLRSVLLDDDLAESDPVDIADEGVIGPNAIAASEDEFLVMYYDAQIPNRLNVRRLDLQGVPNGTPVEIPRTRAAQGSPSRATWTGTNWVIVYVDDEDNDADTGWDVYALRFGCP